MFRWTYLLLLVVVASACKKEDKEYTVDLEATCWDCIVTYAGGTDRGRTDTIFGIVEGTDSIPVSGRFVVVVKESDNLFFRACRMDPDSSFGSIQLRAFGGIQDLSAAVDRASDCAVINQPVVVQ